MFKLRKERINFKKKIGSGASGTVYPYQKDADDSKWVIKRMHADDTDQLLNLLPEIVLGFSCDHPCILPLKGYSIEKGDQEDFYVFLKFPRMKETLKDKADELRKSNKLFPEEEILRYFYSMVCAVEYLHKKKIYHRDIKPGNILLDENGNAMLSDVGVAKHVGEEEAYQPLTGQGGTVDYTAPELLKDKSKLTKESLIAGDAWSLGLVMLELCMLKNRLFNPYSAPEKIEEVQKGLFDQLKEIYSIQLVKLIFQLLKFEPNERIKISDLKQKLEDEYHLGNILSSGAQLDEEEKMARKESKQLVENITQENFQLQNELQEYRSFLSQLQSEIFSGFEISENEVLKKVLANYQNSLKKLREGDRAIINHISMQIREPNEQEEEKKEPRQDSLRSIPNANRLQNQRVFDFERLGKMRVIFTGFARCGKSSIVSVLKSEPFKESRSETIGASYSHLTLQRDGKQLKLNLWDLSGQEKFKEITHFYFKDIPFVIVVYDITSRLSFDRISAWIALRMEHFKGPMITLILGAKLDCASERKVSKEEAEALAREYRAMHLEVSAKTGENIEGLREKMMDAILKNYDLLCSLTPTAQTTERRRSGIFSWLLG